MKTLYTAIAETSGGRNGKVQSNDGVLSLELRLPKELGGPGGAYTNPEQLFAAGYSACFDSALSLVLMQAKIKPSAPTTVKAEVSIGANDAGGYGLAVKLAVSIPGVELDLAESLVAKAHSVCPYSNATRGNVEVTLEVIS